MIIIKTSMKTKNNYGNDKINYDYDKNKYDNGKNKYDNVINKYHTGKTGIIVMKTIMITIIKKVR